MVQANPVLVVGVVDDDAERPLQVLGEAAALAIRMNASLVIATVDPKRYPVGVDREGRTVAADIDPDLADEVAEEFDPAFAARIAAELDPLDIPYGFRALAGEPAHALARLAHETDALAIVVGTREPGVKTRAREFLNGSVAVHLAHRQHRPVIVVPLDPMAHGGRLPWGER